MCSLILFVIGIISIIPFAVVLYVENIVGFYVAVGVIVLIIIGLILWSQRDNFKDKAYQKNIRYTLSIGATLFIIYKLGLMEWAIAIVLFGSIGIGILNIIKSIVLYFVNIIRKPFDKISHKRIDEYVYKHSQAFHDIRTAMAGSYKAEPVVATEKSFGKKFQNNNNAFNAATFENIIAGAIINKDPELMRMMKEYREYHKIMDPVFDKLDDLVDRDYPEVKKIKGYDEREQFLINKFIKDHIPDANATVLVWKTRDFNELDAKDIDNPRYREWDEIPISRIYEIAENIYERRNDSLDITLDIYG